MSNGLIRAAEVSQLYWKTFGGKNPGAGDFMRWAESNRIWTMTDDEFAAFKAQLAAAK